MQDGQTVLPELLGNPDGNRTAIWKLCGANILALNRRAGITTM